MSIGSRRRARERDRPAGELGSPGVTEREVLEALRPIVDPDFAWVTA